MGANAFISGSILSITKNDQHDTEERRKCKEKSCYDYTVSCTKRKVSLSTNIRVTNVTLGTVPYSDSITQSITRKHCSDDTVMLPSKDQASQELAKSIAEKFIFKLKPNYVKVEVTLLDDEDIDYTDKEAGLLENGLEYINQNRLDKAEQLLSNLLQSTQSKSYVAAYNLGVVKEAKGELLEAKKYYSLADQLQIEPIEEINTAVNRIKAEVINMEQANIQVNRNTAK